MINNIIQNPCSRGTEPVVCRDALPSSSRGHEQLPAGTLALRQAFLAARCRHAHYHLAAGVQRFGKAPESALAMHRDCSAHLSRATRQISSERGRPMYAENPRRLNDGDSTDVQISTVSTTRTIRTIRSVAVDETIADVFDVVANISNPALFAATEAISLYERQENTTMAKETKDAILIAAGLIDTVTLLIPYVAFVKAIGAFAKLSAMALRNQVPSTVEIFPGGGMYHLMIARTLPTIAPDEQTPVELPSQATDHAMSATSETPSTRRYQEPFFYISRDSSESSESSESSDAAQERAFEASKRRHRESRRDRWG